MERLFIATDFDELQDRLQELDVVVPRHPNDRKHEHVETYTLVLLLASIPWDASCFPVEVFKRERPDFLLKCGFLEVGVEITAASSQNLGKERALRADGHGPNVYFPLPASVHDPIKKKREILEAIHANEPGDGWCGDSVERNWAEAIGYFVQKKVESAKKERYALYGDDRLLIYDNWPVPLLNHQWALPHLRAHLEQANAWSVFKRIYVTNGSKLLELAEETSIHHRVMRPTEI